MQVTPATEEPKRKPIWKIDLLIFLVLCLLAAPARWSYSKGDFWFDEADYAQAAMQGFQANRWDNASRIPILAASDQWKLAQSQKMNPFADEKGSVELRDLRAEGDKFADPKVQMMRLRHYHPPMISYIMALARLRGASDRTLRMPFVFIGALVVGMTYLCGLLLFREKREIAVGVALMVLVTPMQIRAGAHAIPWAPITLNLLALLWTLLQFARSRRPLWILGIAGVLGVLFTVSEIFLPAVVVVLCVTPLLLFPEIHDSDFRTQVVKYSCVGAVLMVLIAYVFWPSGLTGGTLTMLSHYMGVAGKVVDHATLGGKFYERAPRWAYFFWYWRDFRPYLVLYCVGFVGVPVLLSLRKMSREVGVLVLYTLLFLGVAHKAHIIGPQYLAHCLPLMSLLTGLVIALVSEWKRPLGWVLMGASALYIFSLKNPNMIEDSTSRISRSPQAAEYLKAHLGYNDRILIGTQQPTVLYWYLHEGEGIQLEWNALMGLPPENERAEVMARLKRGDFRFFALANTFVPPRVSPEIQQILKGWRIVYQSQEQDGITPRFVLYEAPKKPIAVPR